MRSVVYSSVFRGDLEERICCRRLPYGLAICYFIAPSILIFLLAGDYGNSSATSAKYLLGDALLLRQFFHFDTLLHPCALSRATSLLLAAYLLGRFGVSAVSPPPVRSPVRAGFARCWYFLTSVVSAPTAVLVGLDLGDCVSFWRALYLMRLIIMLLLLSSWMICSRALFDMIFLLMSGLLLKLLLGTPPSGFELLDGQF